MLRILEKHCEKNREDLEARFTYARLLGLIEARKEEGAKLMAAGAAAANTDPGGVVQPAQGHRCSLIGRIDCGGHLLAANGAGSVERAPLAIPSCRRRAFVILQYLAISI